MREDRLPASWLNALANLEPGEASSVLTEESKFHRLILVERSPAKVLDPTQAYPLVEQVLLDQKMRDAFNAWLARKLEVATITISKHLLEQVEDEQDDQPPQDEGEFMGETLEADAEMPAEAPLEGEEQEYPDQMVPDQIPADEDDDLESIPVPAKNGS
ncbi:MAG: hypothetical protein R6W92_15600 [Desulfocurvibacter africanus]